MHATHSRTYRAVARRIATVATAIGLALAAPAFASGAYAAAMKQGGDLRAALTGEPDVLDPATSSIYTGAQVYEQIFSKLIDMDASGNFVPDLATSWTENDPKTWTFKLVPNATFQNGEKFTSADVKYTFQRILDPKTASAYAGLYSQINSVDTPDAQTVVFHLKSPFGPFLTNLATNGEIVNQKAIESGDPARHPVGTGPFQFVEWVQGDHITLRRIRPTSRPACRISTRSPSASCRWIRAGSTRSQPASLTGPMRYRCSRFLSSRRIPALLMPAARSPAFRISWR